MTRPASAIRSRFARLATSAVCVGLLAAACTSSPHSSGSNNANAPAFTTTSTWGPTAWSFNPHGTGYYAGFGVLLPLAFVEKTSNQIAMFQLIPQLMTSYSLSASNVMTLHLVSGAKFSNGEPVNATDVVDTFLVGMLAGQNLPYIENLSASNPTTVVIDFTPQTAGINARGDLAAAVPLPMSQYGQFLPAGMAQNILAYAKVLQNPKTAATALSSPEYQKVAAEQKKLLAYSPPKLIGDGPFMITGINTSSVSEVKSPTYFGASHVHISKLTLLNSISSASMYPQLYSHDIDWYGAATPSSTELSQAKASSGLNEITVSNDVVENMLFNNKSYPFTLTPVRQALAYLINRKTLAETEDGGTLTYNQPESLPDGLGPLLSGIWLTAPQRAQLNPYAYDPSKATSLLQSAGFKKSGGHWMMPNGQQFKAQVIAPATPSNAALFATETASELSAFGISATANTVPAASYQTQYEKGSFQVAWATGVNSNLEPVCGIANGGLGNPWNYNFDANGATTLSSPGIGFGPNFNVPGHGVIPVSQTIVRECQTTNAGPELAARAWDWAQVVNQQVPFLSYADDEAANFYSTSHYTNWPPASSWLWQESGMFPTQALQMMIQNGYVSPS